MALSDKDHDAFLILQSGQIRDAMEGLALPCTVLHGLTDLGKPADNLAQQTFSRAVEQITIQHRQEKSKCTIS
jgi:hypothetical protein